MRKLFFITVLIALVLPASAHAQERKKFTIGGHIESTAGVSSSQTFDFVNAFIKSFEKDSGYRLNLVKFPSHDDVEQSFIENKVDGAWLFSHSAVVLLDQGYSFYPVFTFMVEKKRKDAFCIWHSKTDKPVDISDIVGKTLLNNKNSYDHVNLAFLRLYLFENGIDKPLWEVFSSFTAVPSDNSALIALAMGKADYLWGAKDFAAVLKMINPGVVTKLEYSFCTDHIYSRGGVVFNQKTVTEADYKMVTTAMKKFLKEFSEKAKENPSLNAMKQYMKLVKAKFIPADMDEYKTDLEIYRKAKEKGWIEELKYIERIMKEAPMGKAIEIRPDMEYCKKKCGEEDHTCIVKCLE